MKNPLGAASINGYPITSEGELMAMLKRQKTAGVVQGSSDNGGNNNDKFGEGIISESALRAVGDQFLNSELKPLKEAWDKLMELLGVFRKTATVFKHILSNNPSNQKQSNVTSMVQTLRSHIDTINKAQNFIRDEVARVVAGSDLISRGYGGDPTHALVSPHRYEFFGVLGAISSGVQDGLNGLYSMRNIDVDILRRSLEEQVVLPNKQGKVLPEHGNLRFNKADQLITNSESIFRSQAYNVSGDKLKRVIDTIVQGFESIDAAQRRNVDGIAPMTLTTSNEIKRHGVIKLLNDNPVLLQSISNTLYFGREQENDQPQVTNFKIYSNTVRDQNDNMNHLFSTKVR